LANRLGGPLPLNETGPAIVRTVEFWWAGLTGTARLSASALGRGNRARKNRAMGNDGDFCSGCVFCP